MKLQVLFLGTIISLQLFSQDKPAYKVFTDEGKSADYGAIIQINMWG